MNRSIGWRFYLNENRIVNPKLLTDLIKEAKELIAIFVSSLNKAKGK